MELHGQERCGGGRGAVVGHRNQRKRAAAIRKAEETPPSCAGTGGTVTCCCLACFPPLPRRPRPPNVLLWEFEIPRRNEFWGEGRNDHHRWPFVVDFHCWPRCPRWAAWGSCSRCSSIEDREDSDITENDEPWVVGEAATYDATLVCNGPPARLAGSSASSARAPAAVSAHIES
jgi:hypothetical protein